ncbi:hypothetical protein [Bacillus sp. Bos-x628]
MFTGVIPNDLKLDIMLDDAQKLLTLIHENRSYLDESLPLVHHCKSLADV